MNSVGTDATTSENMSSESRSSENVSNRGLDHRVMSSESTSTKNTSTKRLDSEPGNTKSGSSSATASRTVSYGTGGVLPAVPTTVEGRSAWFAAIARDEELAILQLAALGAHVSRLGEAFSSLINGEIGAAELTRGQRSNEIVYHDRSLAGTVFEFMPLPFALACQVNARLVKPPVRQLIEWRPRLLDKAGLIVLPEVRLLPLLDGVTEETRMAYEGVKLLFGCRWYLEPGTAVPYSITFIETWCGITRAKAVAAREHLRRYVLREVETVACGRPKKMQLFLPRELESS